MRTDRTTDAKRIAAAAIVLNGDVSLPDALAVCPFRSVIGRAGVPNLATATPDVVAIIMPDQPLNAECRRDLLTSLNAGEILMIASPCRRSRDAVKAELFALVEALRHPQAGAVQ